MRLDFDIYMFSIDVNQQEKIMHQTIASTASGMVRQVMSSGRSTVKIEKAKVMALRAAIHTICTHEGIFVATRYYKDSSELNLYRVE